MFTNNVPRYYSFAPPATGTYRFKSYDGNDLDPDICIYTSTNLTTDLLSGKGKNKG
jgi:hypothetical protein